MNQPDWLVEIEELRTDCRVMSAWFKDLRAEKLTPEQRSDIARKAAAKRWQKEN